MSWQEICMALDSTFTEGEIEGHKLLFILKNHSSYLRYSFEMINFYPLSMGFEYVLDVALPLR